MFVPELPVFEAIFEVCRKKTRCTIICCPANYVIYSSTEYHMMYSKNGILNSCSLHLGRPELDRLFQKQFEFTSSTRSSYMHVSSGIRFIHNDSAALLRTLGVLAMTLKMEGMHHAHAQLRNNIGCSGTILLFDHAAEHRHNILDIDAAALCMYIIHRRPDICLNNSKQISRERVVHGTYIYIQPDTAAVAVSGLCLQQAACAGRSHAWR